MVSDQQLQETSLPDIARDFNKAAPSNPAPDIQTQFNSMAFPDTPENVKQYDLNDDGNFSPEDFLTLETPNFIEKPEDLFDEELITQELGMPVMILDTEFGEKVFGSKNNPETELREIAQNLVKGNEISDTATEKLANAFEEALRSEYPQHTEVFDTVQNSYFSSQAATSFQILKMAEGEPIPGAGSFAAMSRKMVNENDEIVGNTITANNQDNIDWSTTNPTATQYAGQEIDYPYPIEYRMYEIMGEEIEHAHQFEEEYDAYFDFVSPETYTEHYNNTIHITETGGRMGGIGVAKKLVEQQEGPEAAETYAEFSNNLNQATTFHITLRETASKDADEVGSIRGYAYDRNLERYEETGELIDPAELSETRVALAEKVLEPYGLDSDSKQQAFKDFAEQHGYPTFQNVKARMQEIVNDVSTSPEMQEMAASELDALDTLDIERDNIQPHLEQWQQYWADNAPEYQADQMAEPYLTERFNLYAEHKNGFDNSMGEQMAVMHENILGRNIQRAYDQGFLEQFRQKLTEKASQENTETKLDQEDYMEVFDNVVSETLDKTPEYQSTAPKADADMVVP